MSLLQEIEEYEKNLKAEQGIAAAEPVVEEEEREGDVPVVVEPEEAIVEEEPVVDPVAAEPPAPVMSQAEQNAAFMQMRLEAKEEKRRRQELEQKLESLTNPKPNTDPEPSKEANYEGWLEWKVRHLEKTTTDIVSRVDASEQQSRQEFILKKGIEEFNNYEADFRTKAPDYDEAANHMRTKMEESLLLLNPLVTPVQAKQAVQTNLLQMASQYASAGMNPVEEMYKMAKGRFGFTAAPAKPDTAIKPQTIAKVAANAKRSASSLQGGGGNAPDTSLEEAVLNMSTAEMMRLDPALLRRLETGAQ